MKPFAINFSMWWLTVPAALMLIWMIVFLLLRKRRLGYVAASCAIAALVVCAMWWLGYRCLSSASFATASAHTDYVDTSQLYIQAKMNALYFGWLRQRFVDKGDPLNGEGRIFRQLKEALKTHGPSVQIGGEPIDLRDVTPIVPLPGKWKSAIPWWAHFVDGELPQYSWPPAPGKVGDSKYKFCFQIWLLLLPLAVAPCLWTYRRLRYGRRVEAGHCPKCNYDLRATPAKCPECGWSPPAAKPTDSTTSAQPPSP